MGEGREGDWDCAECLNRNYAFRSLCNRCKRPRLLVDATAPAADSKWLPRAGDWICSDCSNNNYASREKCKKCGQPKDEAAMTAIAVDGASLLDYELYFARLRGMSGLRTNYGNTGNSCPALPNSGWTHGGFDNYGLQSIPRWPIHAGHSSGVPYMNNMNQFSVVPKDWRKGDWLCNCGFHNYSSRAQCRRCNAPFASLVPPSVTSPTVSDMFPALGMKRSASEEVNGWDNKRLNAGDIASHFLLKKKEPKQSYPGFDQLPGFNNDLSPRMYSRYASGNSMVIYSAQLKAQFAQLASMAMPIGKSANQWRDRDWMCNNCNNHNYASRTHCNRCKMLKEVAIESVLHDFYIV